MSGLAVSSRRRSDPFATLLGRDRTGGLASRREETYLPSDPAASLPANTRLSYMYRDADNYKATRTVVLAGRYEDEDLPVIAAALFEGDGFIPSQVGLEDLQGELQAFDTEDSLNSDGVNDADHPWHELYLSSGIDRTNDLADAAMEWPELVERFRTVTWDDAAGL